MTTTYNFMTKNKASKMIINYTKKYYLNIIMIMIFVFTVVVLFNVSAVKANPNDDDTDIEVNNIEVNNDEGGVSDIGGPPMTPAQIQQILDHIEKENNTETINVPSHPTPKL